MLSREHAIAEYDFSGSRIVPDRLTRATHAQYLGYAQQMLEVYQSGIGHTRRELHQAVLRVFDLEDDCPLRRIEAFCKLLDDVSHYDTDRKGKAAKLRMEVFRMAAAKHPLVRQRDSFFEHDELAVKQEIAERLGRDWPEIDASLFADIIDFQRLVQFDGFPTAAALLARYNVAQFQVALFDATEITVRAKNDFKTILRRAKLARLMHSVRRVSPEEYEIRLDGPASLLRQTRRYGTAMAKFIPSLLACREWSLHSLIRTRRGGWTLALTLTHADGLSSPQEAPEDFDSTIEETFAAKWGSAPREGWTLHRETAILQEGQKIFVPDFEFRHTDGTMIAMEIIGFWTPEYLEAKRQTLQHFSKHRILLAIAHSVEESLPDFGQPRIVYKTAIKLDDVLQALKALRAVE